ncbi:hypothetical protein A1332_17795 [Methylomonas methanica]|uniref:Uncharacterized protein n=1 Tax=Methylomonas methanica TaxID=421 RepID=A0A177M713_METMH|nr:hypothetical protein A1332_17795 [Methylomonas methanica]
MIQLKCLMPHVDQGSQNYLASHQMLLSKHPLFCIMRRKGDCYDTGESLFLPKDFFEHPSRKKSAKITRPLMPAAPRFVRVASFRPNMMTRTPPHSHGVTMHQTINDGTKRSPK